MKRVQSSYLLSKRPCNLVGRDQLERFILRDNVAEKSLGTAF